MRNQSRQSTKPHANSVDRTLPPNAGVEKSSRLHLLFILWPLVLLALAPLPALSQNSGSINGTVVDASGAAVSGANLALTDIGTAQVRNTTSSSQGYFNFPDLQATTYSLKVSAPGFKDYVFDSLRLTVGQQMSLQAPMTVGNITQSVNVTETPPAIQTTTASVGQLIDTEQIENLPLNGRNALSLVQLTAGAKSVGTAGQFGATQQQFSINGSNPNSNNFSLDGGYNMNSFYGIASDYPNPDALQEFSVTTRNYDVTAGKGYNSISAVTRSGSNSLHGSAFEFIRNNVLDASNYFGAKPSPFKRNQFGATLGGKIIKDKLFFFGSYQGTQIRGNPGLSSYLTMTPAERTGDFSDLSAPIIDPTTGLPFPGNQIPNTRIQSYATQFISQFLPLPNSGTNIYRFTAANTESANQAIARIDSEITANDHVFGRYMFDNVPQVGNGVSFYLDSSWNASLPTRKQSILLNYAHVFSTSMVNSATFDYDRDAYGVQLLKKNFSLVGLGFPINDSNAINAYGLTPDSILGVSNYFTAGPGVPTRDIVPVTHFSDGLSMTHGAHQIAVGVEIYHTRVNQLQNYLTGGDISFSGFATGNAAADFMTGEFSDYEQLTPLITRLRQTLPSVYAQDNYRATRRLTVTAGLRWDIYNPWISQNNVLGTYIPGRQSTVFPLMAPGLLYPNDPGIPRGVASSRYNNLAPRVGIAWDVRGDGRTSLRLGSGVFFATSNDAINFNRFPQMPPFGFEANLTGGNAANIWAPPPFNGVDPFPRPDVTDTAALKLVPFVPTSADTSLGLPFKTQVEYQWSMSLQQATWKNSFVEIAYVGSSAFRLLGSYEGNPAVYVPGNSTEGNTQQRRINPNIGMINTLRPYINTNFNALEVTFNKRYNNGLSVVSSLTWSKQLGIQSALSEGANGPRDPFNYRLSYGSGYPELSWWTAVVWDIPFAQQLNPRLLRGILDGWQINGIYSAISGSPFSVGSGLDNSFSGIGGDLADLVGNPTLSGGRSRTQQVQEWFNPAAFTVNAVGTFGNSPFNRYLTPGYSNLDLGLIKHFHIERVNSEFRSLFYNAPNHPTLGGPVANASSPANGQILGTAGDARVIEFAVRFTF